MKSRIYSTLLTAIVVTGFLTSCSNTTVDKKTQLEKLKTEQAALAKQITKLEKEVADENPSAVNVKSKDVGVQELTPRKFDHYIQTQGKIDSEDNIVVSAKSPGVITQVFVREGDLVSKGQTPAITFNLSVLITRKAGAPGAAFSPTFTFTASTVPLIRDLMRVISNCSFIVANLFSRLSLLFLA